MRKAAEQFYVLQQHRYWIAGVRTADENPFRFGIICCRLEKKNTFLIMSSILFNLLLPRE